MVCSHDFGSVTEGKPEKKLLTGSYTATVSGMHTLEIWNTTNAKFDTDLTNYADNVKLVPVNHMLAADAQTFSVFYKYTRKITLTAGANHANQNYWMWMNYTGTFPGFDVHGVNIPLNYDTLLELGMKYPAFLNPKFIGTLDSSGNAEFDWTLQANSGVIGLTIYMSYLVLPNGGGFTVLDASNPINFTMTLLY